MVELVVPVDAMATAGEEGAKERLLTAIDRACACLAGVCDFVQRRAAPCPWFGCVHGEEEVGAEAERGQGQKVRHSRVYFAAKR